MARFKYVLAASLLAMWACADTATAPVESAVGFQAKRAPIVLTNDVERDIESYFLNPCNGEQIAGTSRIRTFVATNDTRSGNTQSNSDFSLAFRGIGLTTGATYNGKLRFGVNYSLGNNRAFELSDDFEMQVISTGSLDNFTAIVRVHVTVNAQGVPTATHELIRSTCRG